MATNSTARTNNNLTLADSFRLMTLLTAEYVSSGKTDWDFAVYATEKLGIKLNKDHIRNRRVSLNIPNNRVVAAAEKKALNKGKIVDRITALETAVLVLLERIEVLEKPFPVLRKETGK